MRLGTRGGTIQQTRRIHGPRRSDLLALVGIIGFIVLVLCGLGLAVVAGTFLVGAPHALPPSPGIAAILFLLALLSVVLGVVLLRRSICALSAVSHDANQKQVRRRLYAVAGASFLFVLGSLSFLGYMSLGGPPRALRRIGNVQPDPDSGARGNELFRLVTACVQPNCSNSHG
jgi:uncharacterized BrkB/YihY/UPF0761 family membrane protein